MEKKFIWLSILAVIVSFIGGFIVANALNRNELENLRTENSRIKNDSSTVNEETGEFSLSDEEIRQKIAEAEQNKNDFGFQKGLGLALYRYASMKQNPQLLSEIEKVLVRANELNNKDQDITIALGNLNFDIGYTQKNNERLIKARNYYQNILEQNPNNIEIRTDLALTYFLQTNPENEKAVTEFQKSLAINPKHEKTLTFLTQTYIKLNKFGEAEKTLATLREVKPNTPSLAEFQTQLAQSETPKQ